MSVFSDRLKQLRLDKQENQTDVAALLGVSVQSYSAYEASREPKYDLLCKLAKHFGVTTDFLLGMNDATKKENVDVMEITGLTEKAVETLKHCIHINKQNSITLTVNALLENRYVLGAIAHYLYYEINKEQPDGLDHDKKIIPFYEKYKYLEDSPFTVWGDNVEAPIDFDVSIEAFTNDKYKKLLMLDVQEELQKLFKQEDEIPHFE